MKNVREPAVAGMFYSESPAKLRGDIQLLLDITHPGELYPNAVGIVSPHAGYLYSGRTAAYAFNAIGGKKFETVVIISPSHKEYFPGASIYSGEAYRTPLGDVPLDKKMIARLTDNNKFVFESLHGHGSEHAVEVQIPFLQMVMRDFSIVPVVIGDQRKMFVDILANKLAEVVDENTLIVASSDLSHFHSKQDADKLDTIIENRIANFEYEKLQEDLDTDRCEACGGGAIIALMKTADLLNIRKSKILSRTDSGDVTGDHSEVVGYLSAIIYE